MADENNSFISPSLAEQFKQMVGDTNFELAGGTADEKKEEEPLFDAEDLQGVVECPFDIAAVVTKFRGFALDDKESKRLAKMFCKPINRYANKVENADLILACTTLATVMMEKWFMYKIYIDDQRKRRLGIEAAGNIPQVGGVEDDDSE